MAIKLSRKPYNIKRNKFSVGNSQGQNLLKCNSCGVWMNKVNLEFKRNKKIETFQCSSCGIKQTL